MNICVYRHISADGETLYIGCSSCPTCRFVGHKSVSAWARDVARIDVQWFDDRDEALAHERELILSERPRYNREWQERPKRSWGANEGHVYLSKWIAETGTSHEDLAVKIGCSPSEVRQLATKVRHVRTARAEIICLATGGAVPTWVWDRLRYFSRRPPRLAPVSQAEAQQNVREIINHRNTWGFRGKNGAILKALIAQVTTPEASA